MRAADELRAIRVLATDYDRTLTDESLTPVPEALEALAEARKMGLRVIVISGRDAPFLERELAHVADAIVAENGCLIALPGERPRPTAEARVDLKALLADVGVPLEHGEILASYANEDEHHVAPRLDGHPVQLIRNRDRTMILPNGIDKASGLLVALELLGLAPDEAAAAGDGENDLPMIRLARHGIAVANAVPELKEAAQYVARGHGGLGVAEWVRDAWMPAQEGSS